MAEQFHLRLITKDGVPAAIDRADHYRLLNQPEQAESICLDVLTVEPYNQRALVTLILAITDQFVTPGGLSPRQAQQYLQQLTNEYSRNYYAGIVAEREARASLTRGPASSLAYDGFRDAMDWYEKALAIRPDGNDDAILRWNACARTIASRRLEPRLQEPEIGLE